MEKEAALPKQATQRCNAPLRERATLAPSRASGPVLEKEMRRSEKGVPALKPGVTTASESTSERHASPPLPAADSASEAELSVANSAPTPRAFSLPGSRDSSLPRRAHKRGRPLLMIRTSPPDVQPRAFSADASARNAEATRVRSASASNHFTIMFALQLFDERHQKSLMGPASLVLIILLSAATALAHCTVVDPASFAGSLLTPSLFTFLVHVNVLCGLYTRGKRRLTAPTLIVYIVCDVIPSLGLSIMSYNLGLIALELHGLRRASFSC